MRSIRCEILVGLTFFHSAATCLHSPARLTQESTKHEGRKPRATERHVVGCCEELGRVLFRRHRFPFKQRLSRRFLNLRKLRRRAESDKRFYRGFDGSLKSVVVSKVQGKSVTIVRRKFYSYVLQANNTRNVPRPRVHFFSNSP